MMAWKTETAAEKQARLDAEKPGPDGKVELSLPPAPPGFHWEHQGGGIYRLKNEVGEPFPGGM